MSAIVSFNGFALIFEISGSLISMAQIAISKEMGYAAWEICQIAYFSLEKTNDIEKMAEMNASFATEFASQGHEYYAALAFQNAADLFKSLGTSGKVGAEANFREAGIRFRKEAENMDLKSFHYAMISLFGKSIRAFLNANEKGFAK